MNLATQLKLGDVRAEQPKLAYNERMTKNYTITATPEVLARFEKFLAHVQNCCGVGHSCEVGMSVDGDGPDSFVVKQPLPKKNKIVVQKPSYGVEYAK